VIKSRNLNLLIINKISDELLISIVKLGIILKIPEDNHYRKLGDDLQSILDNSSKILTKCYLGYIEFRRYADNNIIYYERKSKDTAYIQCTCLESSSILDTNIICESCKLVKSNTISDNNSKPKLIHVVISDIECKYCTKCLSWKKLHDFSKHCGKWDLLKTICKDCDKIRGAIYRSENAEKEALRHKIYDNSEHGKNVHHKYYIDNYDKIRDTQALYRVNHIDEIRYLDRERYANNPEKFKEYQKAYRANPINKELIKARSRIHIFNKRHNDMQFKIRDNLRSRVYMALKGKSKSDNTVKLLGCSLEKVLEYLQSMFEDGMTMDNHGEVWHIDHIIPCSLYDLSNEEEQKCCFNYLNTRPLFVEDNLKRGARLTADEYFEHRPRLCQSIIDRLDKIFDYDVNEIIDEEY
jgi:hypothetical protein